MNKRALFSCYKDCTACKYIAAAEVPSIGPKSNLGSKNFFGESKQTNVWSTMVTTTKKKSTKSSNLINQNNGSAEIQE